MHNLRVPSHFQKKKSKCCFDTKLLQFFEKIEEIFKKCTNARHPPLNMEKRS